MFEPEPPLRPVQRLDGYPPLENLGLIGDGATAALVGLDGSVCWLCLPRFDSEPLLAGLLDQAGGGHFAMTPEGLAEARQYYLPDTAVLVTELRCATGLVRISDALALRPGADISDDTPSGRSELVRRAEVLDGSVRLLVDLSPRGGAQARPLLHGLELSLPRHPGLRLHLRSNLPLTGPRQVHELRQGERLDLVLSWGRSHRHHRFDAGQCLAATADAWRRWMTSFSYRGPGEPLARRAAITLKLCDDWVNGSLVAAVSSSLPAPVGGVRNWDYRYTWIRDAAFSVYAMRHAGFGEEADAFLGWVLDAFERSRRPQIMFDLDGGPVPGEREDPGLEGYRRSAPVRWGNGAAGQRQHDVYGEVLDCAYQWVRRGGELDPGLWAGLSALADAACLAWREPDQGIWEVRSEGRVFTYSAAMCQMAVQRAVGIAEVTGLPGPTGTWTAAAGEISRAILERSWDPGAQTLSEHIDGGGGLDASLLALPLRRVIDARHPKMTATCAAIAERLSAGDGLLYRYLHDSSPDGLPGDEGAFLLCSFWLVDNLAKQGRVDEAGQMYEALCSRASPLGLLPEQIDPATGRFIGNFPQAFSHIGVISSGVNIGLAERGAARAAA